MAATLTSKVHSSVPVVASQLHFLHGDFLKDFLYNKQCYLTTPGKNTREISLVWEITLLLERKRGITAGVPRQRQVWQTDNPSKAAASLTLCFFPPLHPFYLPKGVPSPFNFDYPKLVGNSSKHQNKKLHSQHERYFYEHPQHNDFQLKIRIIL